MDATAFTQQIRVRNVSLHRRGKPEHGTLYLTRHHLIFSYHPNVTSSRNEAVQQQQFSTSNNSNLTGDVNSQTGYSQSPNDSQIAQTAVKTSTKAQPKEIYVPFPLLHHCTLRPSHAPYRPTAEGQAQDGDDELFPPTYGTNAYARPSTDSSRSAQYASPRRPASPMINSDVTNTPSSTRPPALRIRCKDFAIFALHFNGSSTDKSADESARQVFYALRDRCCVSSMEEMYAFNFKPPAEETATGGHVFDARTEFARMGIGAKAPEGPGTAWRITDINNDHSYSPTYPNVICVPRPVSDNILKYCGSFRSKSRIPALAYLHPNGGSITRSSQPLVGVQGKRNPQDEKLVTAIFCSHTPGAPSPDDSPKLDGALKDVEHVDLQQNEDADTMSPRSRVYGSTRRNLIVDARPRINMIANKAAGGGIEDVANYSTGSDTPVEKVFLNIANIHAMRASLDKVVDALGSSDYLDLAPNQDLLRKSGWLGHIAGILDGAEMVARVVGLGGSHALIHCSDGWDRTSQISAMAQVMLDPYYRTLEGFITLIQKDFLSFGHKFKHRQGTEGSEKWFEIENERVQPPRAGKENPDNNLQALSNKALSGARSWFEKNRGTIFKQSPSSKDSSDTSRPTTPPPNPVLHSAPSPTVKEEKHKMDEKEVAPIFHQFLDATYQLLHQEPTAFEFNERFLRRLLYQSYSGQYGEFLFNTEKERAQYQDRTPSVWANFLARKREFISSDYIAKTTDPLLFPRRHGYEREVEVRWWHSLFGRKDEEMNVPRATAPIGVSSFSSLSLNEDAAMSVSDGSPNKLRAARSTPALQSTIDIMPQEDETGTSLASTTSMNDTASATNATVHGVTEPAQRHKSEPSITELEMEGDPLGVSSKSPPASSLRGGGLDFAAFAQQNAFRDR